MEGLTTTERACVEGAIAAQDAMRRQVEAWVAVNSGSRNLAGLHDVAAMLCEAFADLPGEVALVDPAPVEAVDAAGARVELPHGKHLRLSVRPQAPLQLLLTGHMDTVFGDDHPF